MVKVMIQGVHAAVVQVCGQQAASMMEWVWWAMHVACCCCTALYLIFAFKRTINLSSFEALDVRKESRCSTSTQLLGVCEVG